MLLETGEGGATLVIRYECERGFKMNEITVAESCDDIRIDVRATVIEHRLGEAWTARLATPIATVVLTREVAGRSVRGQREFKLLPWPYLPVPVDGGQHEPQRLASGVPRVTGLAVEDAADLLARHGFRTVVRGEGTQVISQKPARGEIPADQTHGGPGEGGSVVLRLGR